MTERDQEDFDFHAAILADLAAGKTSVARLALRHGIAREALLRGLHNHLGRCLAAVIAQAATPSVPLVRKTPNRIRERFRPAE